MRESTSKIKLLSDIAPLIRELKQGGKTIVLSHGVFDLMHYGHIHHLEQTKKMGDVLLVSVVTDAFIQKGPGRPVFDQDIRFHSIASLECVDYVIPCEEIGPYALIKTLQPHIYTKGEDAAHLLDDPASGLNKDRQLVESVQGKLCFTKSLPIHSTDLLKKFAEMHVSET